MNFMDNHDIPVDLVLRVLGIAAMTDYDWRRARRQPWQRARRDAELFVGAGFSDEWFGIEVPVFGPFGDHGAKCSDAGEGSMLRTYVAEFLEPALDEVEPGALRWV